MEVVFVLLKQINRGIIVYICLLQGATSDTVKKLGRSVSNNYGF